MVGKQITLAVTAIYEQNVIILRNSSDHTDYNELPKTYYNMSQLDSYACFIYNSIY